MVIAGALGTAGALMYLAPPGGMHIHAAEILSPQGFNGIPVALLGLSNSHRHHLLGAVHRL